MTLRVHTAPFSYIGPDRFNVTRKSGGVAGIVFAPTWGILRPALNARAEALKLRELDPQGAARLEQEMWDRYVKLYRSEMEQSLLGNSWHWNELLQRSEVTLVCYCPAPGDHCHRRLLAEILAQLGAEDLGERAPPEPPQRRLFD